MPSILRARSGVALTIVGATLALALSLTLWWSPGRSHGAASGPLTINAGNTGLTFSARRSTERWSATAGGFLLCTPGAEVTITGVSPVRASGVESFGAVTRSFQIRHRKGNLVSEPILGGYGAPPWIGGADNPHEDRLPGLIHDAEGATVTPPSCEDYDGGAPGEQVLELLLTVTAGTTGATVHRVSVEYESGGRDYRTEVAVTLRLRHRGLGPRLQRPSQAPPDRRPQLSGDKTAVRELVFRGTPEMLPGTDEHADR